MNRNWGMGRRTMANRANSQSATRPASPPATGMPGPRGRGRTSRIEKARDTRGTLRRLLSTLRPYRWTLLGVLPL